MEEDQSYTHKYAGNAVLRCFASVPEILGFDFSPKNGVQNSILLISAKYWTKLNGSGRILLVLNPFLVAVPGWFPKLA